VPQDGGIGECSSAFTPSISLTPWQPAPPRNLSVAEALQQLEREMSGVWRGSARPPAAWSPPLYEVEIRFGEGHYSARCTSHSERCCLAFYYGSDRDFPEKQFRLLTMDSSERVSGEIDIMFEFGGQPDPPGWQGILQKVETDATRNRLRFEFKTSKGYGPIAYDLQRI
jgi:hypothetical protein